MMLTYTLGTQAANADAVYFAGSAVLSSASRFGAGMPLMIPADQAYYWSHVWQAAEGRAKADLEAGRMREFEDPNDAIHYLLGTGQ